MLGIGAQDRQVATIPAATQRLQAGLKILHKIPRREVADLVQGRPPPYDPRAAREDCIGRVTREHRALKEVRLLVVERVVWRDLSGLGRLHKSKLVVSRQLAHRLAQEMAISHQIVGVACLHEVDVRWQQPQRGVEVAGLGFAFASRIAYPGRAVVAQAGLRISQGEAVHELPHAPIAGVVADQHPQPVARPVLVEDGAHGALEQSQRLAERGDDDRDHRLLSRLHRSPLGHRSLPAVDHGHQGGRDHDQGGEHERNRQPRPGQVGVGNQPRQEPGDARDQRDARGVSPAVLVNCLHRAITVLGFERIRVPELVLACSFFQISMGAR